MPPTLTGVSARYGGAETRAGSWVAVIGSASIVNTMSVVSVAASPARVRESTDSGAVVSPEEKSRPMSCGMSVISAIVHARDAANPVSPTETQVTAEALAHAQIAHLEE